MPEYIDLHCHFLAEIDDGARDRSESLGILRGLQRLGFQQVIATPHMRPGLFDNDKTKLEAAFAAQLPSLLEPDLPKLGLASEHYFDALVVERILANNGLPYPGGKAVLLEFYEIDFPLSVDRLLANLRVRGWTPVIAHPERYRAIWKDPEVLERLLDLGTVALLDAAALVGKYGRRAQKSAELLLERGYYHAACSDAHRPEDIHQLELALALIRKRYGEQELQDLFEVGPREILEGRVKS